VSIELVFCFYLAALISFGLATIGFGFRTISFVALGLFLWLFPTWWNTLEAL